MNDDEMTGVDCTKFEEILHDLDRPGSRALALREDALAHAESCSDCARLMTESESLDFALQGLATHSVSQAPPRIEATLVHAFRKQKAEISRRRIQWRIGAIASAAVALVSLGLSLHQRSGPGAVSMPAASGGDDRSSSVSAAPTAFQAQTSHFVDDENQTSDSESASPFVSLPFADDPATLEGGAVVRVVLSGSALASLGMSVPDFEPTDQIPADILLSEDGAPQAVRLVSQLDAQ